jgi:NAD(P)H-hydrate epimerase
VADIGYPPAILAEATRAKLIDASWTCDLLPERLLSSHKGENGSVLIVAGSRRMPGAASLAARAALRSGAGLVTVASVPSVCDAVAANVPEALLMPLPERNGVVSPEAAMHLAPVESKYQAILFGPGMTHEEPVKEFFAELWRAWSGPCVIDADALNSVSEGVTLPKGECVLTPHPGEMSRLLQSSIAEIQADRLNTVREAVGRFGKTMLLKGPYSIVGAPDEPMLVNSTGNSGMASGGMGDVLSGVIATLLAQQLPPYQAAGCGMLWHGLAGDLCDEEIGSVGYTASEVADRLPEARATITAPCEPD